MEDGLVLSIGQAKKANRDGKSLNPYCSGRWSRTTKSAKGKIWSEFVLILIVVEDGLVRMLDLKKTGELKS